MKKSTKKKIEETVKKGVIGTRKAVGEVKKISGKTVSYVKKRIPSEKGVKNATRITARFATKTALATKDRTQKIAKKVYKTGRDIANSVRKGIEEAKKERGR